MSIQSKFYRSEVLPHIFREVHPLIWNESPRAISKITFSCEFTVPTLINWLSSVLALEFVFGFKPVILKVSKPNVSLALKKGVPCGCSIALKGKALSNFLDAPNSEALFPHLQKSKNEFDYVAEIPFNILSTEHSFLPYDYSKNMPEVVRVVVSFNTCLLL